MNRRYLRLQALLSLMVLSGCSLFFALLSDREQCSEESDPDRCEDPLTSIVCRDGRFTRIECTNAAGEPTACIAATGQCEQSCGDGFIQVGEECDPPGVGDCNLACRFIPNCGDGIVQRNNAPFNPLEQCDDGNVLDGDGCDSSCKLEVVEEIEPNDDGTPDVGGGNEGNDFDSSSAQGPFTKDTLIHFERDVFGDEDIFAIKNTSILSVSVRVDVFREISSVAGVAEQTPFGICSGPDFSDPIIIGVLNLRDEQGNLLAQDIGRAEDNGCPGISTTLAPQQTIFVHHVDNETVTIGDDDLLRSLFIDFERQDPLCGDGFVHPPFEECDAVSEFCDACQHKPICGDNYLDQDEFCDDGNFVAGDGCNPDCKVDGAILEVEPNPDEAPQVITGDSLVMATGEIEEGPPNNFSSNDSFQIQNPTNTPQRILVDSSLVIFGFGAPCRSQRVTLSIFAPGGVINGESLIDGAIDLCEQAEVDLTPNTSALVRVVPVEPVLPYFLQFTYSPIICGDGDVSALEGCDDGNNTNGDGCDSSCTVEPGFVCEDTTPSLCHTISCGDGFIDAPEVCDDGNTASNDGCAGDCLLFEPGFACLGEPTLCHAIVCGDGLTDFPESCDDGNTNNGDSCGADCDPFITIDEAEPNDDGSPAIIEGVDGNDFSSANANGPISNSSIVNASITPLGDEDVFEIANTNTSRAFVRLDTFDATKGIGVSCGSFDAGGIDTVLNIRLANGSLLLQNDEREGGVDSCSGLGLLLNPNQSVFAHVLEFSEDATINAYLLQVTITPIICGDGLLEPTEFCDDGNLNNGDGCSSICQPEFSGFACGAGQTLIQLSSTDVPKAIPDGDFLGIGITSNATISDNRLVKRVIVGVDSISHPFVGDLELSMISPTGVSVLLSKRHGNSGDNYIDTIFDDNCVSADGFIGIASAPFTGCFTPDEFLSAFNNQSASGVWKLKVADFVDTDQGILNAWTLGLCVQ